MKNVKIVVSIVILLVTSIFLSKTLLNYFEQTKLLIYSVSPFKVLLSIVFFLGYLYLRALSWRSLIFFLGASINVRDSLSVWFFSEATRYIPGSLWSFVSRAYFAQQKNVSRAISILISPIEAIVLVTATISLSLYAILKNLEKLEISSTFYILVIISLIVMLILLVLHRRIIIIFKKLLIQKLVPKNLPKALALQVLSWILYSGGYIILISDYANQDLLNLVSSTILAWLIGYLSIITPMGLGVRETALVLLIGAQIGTPQAVVIGILARVLLAVSELLNLLLYGVSTNNSILKKLKTSSHV